MLLCSVASSLLAHMRLGSIVIVVTAARGALVSWDEFSDSSRKVDRYTRAVRALKDLILWWDALTDVEQQSQEHISTLIQAAEGIIADERAAWMSTTQPDSSDGKFRAMGQGDEAEPTSKEGKRSERVV